MLHSLSFWERETFFTHVDCVIIGAGLVGLNAALHLKTEKPKLKIVVLERGIVPYGASTRNAGFACFGSAGELLDDLENDTEENVYKLVERRYKGLQKIRAMLGDNTLNYQSIGAYELFSDREDKQYRRCAENLNTLNKNLKSLLGLDKTYSDASKEIRKFGFENTNYLIKNQYEGQLDSGKMMQALLHKVKEAGIEIFCGLEVKKIENTGSKFIISTAQGIDIGGQQVLLATNAFARQLFPNLDVKPGRAQVLITHEIKNLKVKGSFHYDRGYYYFRNVGKRLLLGGGRNLDFAAEETTEFGLSTLVQNKLEELLKHVILPHTAYKIDMRWSGIMGMGSKKTSIVKKIDTHLYCAVRCGGMGVALSSLLGQELAELALAEI